MTSPIRSGVALAAAAAVAFGITTPWVAIGGAGLGPLTVAALLYAGAFVVSIAARPFVARTGAPMGRAAVPRLLLVALTGSIVAPTLLAWGIARSGPTASSLALNFEAVFAVLLAATFYREPIGERVWAAMLAMALGGALLAVDQHRAGATQLVGLLAILGATAAWAADSTLTRRLAEHDPFDVIAVKAALGCIATAALARARSEPAPSGNQLLLLLGCGAVGYGLSLRFYLLAQRRMGAARTASVFACGPFVGAAVAWLIGDRTAGGAAIAGTIAFALGVYLHATERHRHSHRHEAIEHEHAHRHDDAHHGHAHDPPHDGEHTHAHRHEPVVHEHEHAPDVHHDHTH